MSSSVPDTEVIPSSPQPASAGHSCPAEKRQEERKRRDKNREKFSQSILNAHTYISGCINGLGDKCFSEERAGTCIDSWSETLTLATFSQKQLCSAASRLNLVGYHQTRASHLC